MGKPLLLLLTLRLLAPILTVVAMDDTTLVYKGCSTQLIQDPTGSYSQALSTLFGTLVSQSTKAKFFKTTESSITGLFQCRGDLTLNSCYNCVSNLPVLTDKLCGQTTSARIQLYGCYLRYEASSSGGSSQTSGMDMLYKVCGRKTLGGSGAEEKRDTAFNMVVNGVVSGHGFYVNSYKGVYVLGQCEGDVGDSDCGACVQVAVQKAQVECGDSVSGQLYLDKCFISYSYYPNGVPSTSSSSSSSASASSSSSASYSSGTGTGHNGGRTVAIILGGAAGVGFLIICLLFARGLMKKHEDF